jgi:hypothetical protein
MDNYQILIAKLDEFIRKYYKNQIIRGIIYSVSVFLLFYLFIILAEYFGHFNTFIRTVFFYLFIAINGFIIARLIVNPLSKLYKLFGETISHEQAAEVIGKHFKNVNDKIINTLQLKKQESSTLNVELLNASINQKILELNPIPFSSAVNLNENKKYIKYAIAPFFVLLVIVFVAPSIIKESTLRLLEHRTYFEKPAPFKFSIENTNTTVMQDEDFELNIKVDGAELPALANIEIEGNQFVLEKKDKMSFTYTFKNIQQTTTFRLFADGFYSKEFTITVLPKPVILGFDISLVYPTYLGKVNETLKNTGDLVIPIGTKVAWVFNTRNTEKVNLKFVDTLIAAKRTAENGYEYSKKFFKDIQYEVTSFNTRLQNKNALKYSINVIPDLYPTIQVEEKKDSVYSKRLYFNGVIKDDYGFSQLTFNYRYLNKKDSLAKTKSVAININKKTTQDAFFYYWDLATLSINSGDEIEYYFEVKDNDGLVGGKSTRSQSTIFKAPTADELEKQQANQSNELKSDFKDAIKQEKDIQKEIADLKKKLIEKKSLNWEDKKKAEDLLKKQADLQKNVENIKKENQANIKRQSEYKESDKNIVEKQQQLNELMDQVLNPEMKKMMEELQKALEQTDKKQLQDQLDKMKVDNKDLEKQLDRALETFKKMEIAQKIQDNINKLDELAKKQDELAKASENKNADSKDLKEKQENQSKEFENTKKDLKDIEQKDKALENPNGFNNPEKEEQDIQKDQKDSEDQLSIGKPKNASKSQKSAADKMKSLAQKMKKDQEDAESEQAEEDINSLRTLLKNLLSLSFNQEALIADLKATNINNPLYLKISQQQKNLKDDSKMIEDSLFALSKRVPKIKSIINKEIGSVNLNIEKSIVALEARDIAQAQIRQQQAMTSINNLALLMNEALQQMQQQQANAKSGSASCKRSGKKPGSPSMSAAQLKKMQEKLNQQMKDMKDGMRPGGKPGKGMNQQLAKMAAQQEYIRNEMQKMNNEQNKDGKNSLGNLDGLAKQMEQTETDLVNKILNQETNKRQQEILTRLLEAEKAEKQREEDNKRESNEAKNKQNSNPSEFTEYKRTKQKEIELIKTVPPSLSPFYKKKSIEYFQNLGN